MALKRTALVLGIEMRAALGHGNLLRGERLAADMEGHRPVGPFDEPRVALPIAALGLTPADDVCHCGSLGAAGIILLVLKGVGIEGTRLEL